MPEMLLRNYQPFVNKFYVILLCQDTKKKYINSV